MTVLEAYVELEIPPNLQEHMLRVGALLSILSEHWVGGKIDVKALVLAGLFHDLANILKFDFDKPELLGKEALKSADWKQVQTKVRDRYGDDLHRATLMMGKEIGLGDSVLRIIEGMEWDRTHIVLKQGDWEVALAIYADMRVGPFGILPLRQRLDDLHHRRAQPDFEKTLQGALELEKTIRGLTKLSPGSITKSDVEQRFESLRLMRYEDN